MFNRADLNKYRKLGTVSYLASCKKLAFYDALTKVKNRNALEKDRKMWNKVECYIYIADVNNLKRINDTKGHRAGDIAIKNTANRLKRLGEVYRLGGDEFLLIAYTRFAIEGKRNFALGHCFKPVSMSLSEAMKVADSNMYKDKVALKFI